MVMNGTIIVENFAMRRTPPEMTMNSKTAIIRPTIQCGAPKLFSIAIAMLFADGPVTRNGTPIDAHRANRTAKIFPSGLNGMPCSM